MDPSCARFPGFSHFPYWAPVSGCALFSYFRKNCSTIFKNKIRGKKIHFPPDVTSFSHWFGGEPAVPGFNRRGLTREGSLFSQGSVSSVPSSRKKIKIIIIIKKQPQVWPAYKSLEKKSSQQLGRIWFEFVQALLSVPVPGRLQSVTALAGWAFTGQVLLFLGVMWAFVGTQGGETLPRLPLPRLETPAWEQDGERSSWWGGNGQRHWDRDTWRTLCEDIWRRSNEEKRKEEKKRKEEVVGVRLVLEFCGCSLGRARFELGFACLEL